MKISVEAQRLYELLPETCWKTERHLAKELKCRPARIKLYKDELEAAKLVSIYFLPNGKRANPVHKIIKHSGSPIKSVYMVCLSEWNWLDRNSLIECYLKSNLNIVPFEERGKKPIRGLAIRDWVTQPRERQMDFFFKYSRVNIGLVVPEFTVVDVDCKNNDWLKHKSFKQTLTVSTPRGFHFYFHADPVVRSSAGTLPNVDTKCKGCFLVLPGSIHPSGKPYEWQLTTTPAELPIEFRRTWRQRDFEERRQLQNWQHIPDIIEDGRRSTWLFRYGRHLRAKGKTIFEIERELIDVNRLRCSPPKTNAEIRKIVHDVDKTRDKPGFHRGAGLER